MSEQSDRLRELLQEIICNSKAVAKWELVLRRCKNGSSRWIEADRSISNLYNRIADICDEVKSLIQ